MNEFSRIRKANDTYLYRRGQLLPKTYVDSSKNKRSVPSGTACDSCYVERRISLSRIYDSTTAALLPPFFLEKVYSGCSEEAARSLCIFNTLFIYSSATSPSLMAGIKYPAESAYSLPILTRLLIIFHRVLADLIQALTLTIRLSMDDPVSHFS